MSNMPKMPNVMMTSFPDLPYTGYEDALLNPDDFHSTAKSTPRTYPRTDLDILRPWSSFPIEIHDAIQSSTRNANVSPEPFPILFPKKRVVANEEELRSHANVELHEPVVEILKVLGVQGRFAMPGGGNVAIVGSPDFSWVKGSATQRPHPKMIVCGSVHFVHY
jgi:hypothetical protein